MSSNISAIETTVQKTHAWIDEVERQLGWSDKHAAYLALRVVLHHLRDRLTVEEAADLGAQLPMLVRGIYYEGWRPGHVPVKERTLDAFLEGIAEDFPTKPGAPGIDASAVTQAVFSVLAGHVSEGEVDDIKAVLPEQLRSLWPA